MFVLTGGGSGLGKALAFALAARKKKVLIVGRREELLAETASQSALISYVCADVSTPSGREHIVEKVSHLASLEGFIHNAATIEPIAPLAEVDELAWREALATNVEAPLFLTQRLQTQLQSGRVLHIGSAAAYFAIAGWSAYCVSKAALAMLTKCWQLESKDIAFASVMPGIIDTPMQAVVRAADYMEADKQQFFRDLYKADRLISPDVVALFLCWLLLDIDSAHFSSREWDIYDTRHHSAWLVPPYSVPSIE